jgi:hypothetical protein
LPSGLSSKLGKKHAGESNNRDDPFEFGGEPKATAGYAVAFGSPLN